ncbi:MAG: hypothetical protein OEY93_09575, partial [Anaerolineae bacterium]|nr:hypothetical protein [Anaerolineae bacterium]
MESLTRPGFSVFYDSEERQAAERIADACEEILHLLQDLWGLETPKDLRVYVMVSYLPFILHSPPWFWWPLLVWFLPFTYLNARRLWRYAGGWAQRYGSRNAIGIKAPNVLQAANTTLG